MRESIRLFFPTVKCKKHTVKKIYIWKSMNNNKINARSKQAS